MSYPHSILGLSVNATEAEIHRAYKKKALQYHPDKNPGDPQAEANFKKLGQAYEELTNPQRKQGSVAAGGGDGAYYSGGGDFYRGGGFYQDDDDDEDEEDDAPRRSFYETFVDHCTATGVQFETYGMDSDFNIRFETPLPRAQRQQPPRQQQQQSFRGGGSCNCGDPNCRSRNKQPSHAARKAQKAEKLMAAERARQRRERERAEEERERDERERRRARESQQEMERLQREAQQRWYEQKQADEYEQKFRQRHQEHQQAQQQREREAVFERQQEKERSMAYEAELRAQAKEDARLEKLERARSKAEAPEKARIEKIKLLGRLLEELPEEEECGRERLQAQEQESRNSRRGNFEHRIPEIEKQREEVMRRAERKREKATKIAEEKQAARQKAAEEKAAAAIVLLDSMLKDLPAEEISQRSTMQSQEEKSRTATRKTFEDFLADLKEKELAADQAERQRAKDLEAAARRAEAQAAQQMEYAAKMKARQEREEARAAAAAEKAAAELDRQKRARDQATTEAELARQNRKQKIAKKEQATKALPCATPNCRNRSSIQDTGDHQWYCEPCFSAWENSQQQQEDMSTAAPQEQLAVQDAEAEDARAQEILSARQDVEKAMQALQELLGGKPPGVDQETTKSRDDARRQVGPSSIQNTAAPNPVPLSTNERGAQGTTRNGRNKSSTESKDHLRRQLNAAVTTQPTPASTMMPQPKSKQKPLSTYLDLLQDDDEERKTAGGQSHRQEFTSYPPRVAAGHGKGPEGPKPISTPHLTTNSSKISATHSESAVGYPPNSPGVQHHRAPVVKSQEKITIAWQAAEKHQDDKRRRKEDEDEAERWLKAEAARKGREKQELEQSRPSAPIRISKRPADAANASKREKVVAEQPRTKCATLKCKNPSSIQDTGDQQWYCEPCFTAWEEEQQRDEDQEGYQQQEACANCGVCLAEPNQCSACKQVVYCSRECQKADWKHHRAACKKLASKK